MVLFLAAIVLLFFLTIGRLFISNILSGRVHFPEKDVGVTLKMEDGKPFTIFRRLQVDGRGNSNKKGAVFKVRFRFKSLEFETNKRLSMIPAPFLMGMEGFREKYWTFNEKTDEFQGIYQWESKESAEKYPDSFIFRLMTKRAAPGTVLYEIMPDKDLSEYIEKAIIEK